MTDHSGPEPAEPKTGEDERQSAEPAASGTDRASSCRWVPLTAGLTSLFIGLGYIVEGVLPGLTRASGLNRSGYLGSLTRTADVIIGLLLLMVSHGLRRRKRRAWEAVMALLATGLVIHAVSASSLQRLIRTARWPAFRPVSTAVSALADRGPDLVPARVLRGRRPAHPLAGALGAVLPARGRPGHRPGLICSVSRLACSRTTVSGSASSRSCTSLVGFSGPVQFKPAEPRRPLRLRHRRAWPVHPGGRRLHVPAARRRPSHVVR